jgi:hypothetical protein
MHTVGAETLSKAWLSALGKSAFENDEQEPKDQQGNGRVATDENPGHEDRGSDQPEHGS